MANFTITIPDEKAEAVVNAFCAKYGWTENSPLTKPQFAKQAIRDYIRGVYIEQKKSSFDMDRKKVAKDAKTYMDDVDVS